MLFGKKKKAKAKAIQREPTNFFNIQTIYQTPFCDNTNPSSKLKKGRTMLRGVIGSLRCVGRLQRAGCSNGSYAVEDRAWSAGLQVIDLIKESEIEEAEEALGGAVDVTAADGFGSTALILAARGGHVALVEALLKQGADVKTANSFGSTALVCAASNNHTATASLLLAHHSDVNHKTRVGSTALIKAAGAGHSSMCDLLLKHGADPSVVSKLGQKFQK